MVATFLVWLMIPLLSRFGISFLDIIVATHAIVYILQPRPVHSPLTSTSLLSGHLPTNGCFSVFHAMNPSSLSKLTLFAGTMIADACSTPHKLASVAESCFSETESQ
jgi:hypothetical protein